MTDAKSLSCGKLREGDDGSWHQLAVSVALLLFAEKVEVEKEDVCQ